MIIQKIIQVLSVPALVVSFSMGTSSAAEKPSKRADKNPPIEVVRINPSSGDIQRVKQKGPQGQEIHVHVVKLYVNMPEPGATAYRLYIGDNLIEEYGSFDEGIFFKSYDRANLNSWRGLPIRFVTEDEVIELGMAFPVQLKAESGTKFPDLKEALKGK